MKEVGHKTRACQWPWPGLKTLARQCFGQGTGHLCKAEGKHCKKICASTSTLEVQLCREFGPWHSPIETQLPSRLPSELLKHTESGHLSAQSTPAGALLCLAQTEHGSTHCTCVHIAGLNCGMLIALPWGALARGRTAAHCIQSPSHPEGLLLCGTRVSLVYHMSYLLRMTQI